MDSLKRKVLPRRFSIKNGDSKPPFLYSLLNANAPLSADYHSYEEADEETQKQLEKEFAEAEKHGWAQGKPGSFLNKLIQHGNKKTEEEFAKAEKAEGKR
ncbi:MAG: hypothetical protein Q9196_006276 [Gyalolechia fulgens]